MAGHPARGPSVGTEPERDFLQQQWGGGAPVLENGSHGATTGSPHPHPRRCSRRAPGSRLAMLDWKRRPRGV